MTSPADCKNRHSKETKSAVSNLKRGQSASCQFHFMSYSLLFYAS